MRNRRTRRVNLKLAICFLTAVVLSGKHAVTLTPAASEIHGWKDNASARSAGPFTSFDLDTSAENEDMENKIDPITTFSTPEMYGAKGDGKTDDTKAIQAAVDSGKTVWISAEKTYYVSRPIVISGEQQRIECDGTIYSDADYAIEIRTAVYSRLYFARIVNRKGGGIHIAVSKPGESMSYSTLGFGVLMCATECIKIDTANGRWCNENRFECGQFREGEYAVYAVDCCDAVCTYSCIEGNAFYNAGIEGTKKGFFLGRVWNTYIINPRYAESPHFLTTRGKCSINLLLKNITTDEKIQLSDETRGTMICSEFYSSTSGGEMDGGSFYTISGGQIFNSDHSGYHNTVFDGKIYDLTNVAVSDCPTVINAQKETETVILNDTYGRTNGINSIWVCANETSERVLSIQKNGTEIARIGKTVPDYAWVRIDWIAGVDLWMCSVLQDMSTRDPVEQ